MASSESRSSDIVTPNGKVSAVWKHFGFRRSDKDQKRALCKLCANDVSQSGGTTNLWRHLQTWHKKEYDELNPTATDNVPSTSKQQTMDLYVRTVSKYSHDSERAKKLTSAVCQFVVHDIRPVSVVDNVGFLNLMYEAEPRYVVPCRSTISRRIDDLYVSEKRRVRGDIASAEFLCCTTDMWTSCSNDGYISLTCHFITEDFKMSYRNLNTKHFPGTHDHTHICEAISSVAQDWCINIKRQVVAFTTDNGSNIVKSLKEMSILHVPCAGHTLNLAVQKAVEVQQVSGPVGRCRLIVAHFSKSRVDSDELKKAQSRFPDIPKHNLIKVCHYILHKQVLTFANHLEGLIIFTNEAQCSQCIHNTTMNIIKP